MKISKKNVDPISKPSKVSPETSKSKKKWGVSTEFSRAPVSSRILRELRLTRERPISTRELIRKVYKDRMPAHPSAHMLGSLRKALIKNISRIRREVINKKNHNDVLEDLALIYNREKKGWQISSFKAASSSTSKIKA